MARQVLTETYQFRPIGNPIILENAASGERVYRRTGVMQNYVRKNQNGRIYPKAIWEDTLKEGSKFHNRLKSRLVLGLLEHPKDGQTRLDYGPALLITDARIATAKDIKESTERGDAQPLEEGDIIGTIEFLDTHNGKELKALDKAGVPICVSSRGTGSVREESGAMIVEDFELETWDAVFAPSVERAVLTRSESAPEKTGTPVQESGAVRDNSTKAGIDTITSPTPVAETHPKPPMSKLNELRQLESQVVSLTCTNVRALKTMQKMSLLNTVTETRVSIDRLVQEDPALRTVASRIHRKLNEFENDLSAEAPAPAAPAAPAAAPGGEDVPAVTDGPQGGESATSDDIRQAAELLQSSEDPSAAELAPKLTALADEMAAEEQPQDDPNADPSPGGDAASGADDAPAAGGGKDFSALESRHKNLLQATAKILERYNALKKSSQADGLGLDEDGAGRKVATTLLGEKKELEEKLKTSEDATQKWESTARDLAQKYNQDMIEMGLKYWALKKPDLFEANKEALTKAETFEAFTEMTANLLKEEADEVPSTEEPVVPPEEDADKTKETPAAPAPAKGTAEQVGESKAKTDEAKRLEEAAVSVSNHPALRHVNRVRTHGGRFGN